MHSSTSKEAAAPGRIRSIRHLPDILNCLGLLLAVGTLASCGTGSPGKPVSSPVVLQPAHWWKARNNPPTYFPKGVPADHPTTASDGMWVMTGDPVGTRYFIPVRGVNTEALTAEALTTRTPEQLRKIEKGENVDLNPAEMLGKAATGLGYALLEVDRHNPAYRNGQGAGRGVAGVWQDQPRR